MKKNRLHYVSFRCFYDDDSFTQHRQTMKFSELGKWIDAYTFTHPHVKRISVCVWPNEPEITEESE